MPAIVDLEDGRKRTKAKESKKPLETGKARKQILP